MKRNKNGDKIEKLRENVIKTLSKIARIDENEFNDSTLIREELGIDSIMAIEILANIEKHYDVKLEEKKINNCQTIGEFIAYIQSLV